jgi:hypothetical protein
MDQNVPTLSSVFPPWEAISDRYEVLFSSLGDGILDPLKRVEKEESLFWEQFAFELIITMLLAKQIPFETSANDVQPLVTDLNGTEKEIDFRIRIQEKDIYFGVTHFYGRAKDLEKDTEEVDIPIRDLKKNGILQPETVRMVSIRPHTEYLNRRMVVRVAKEGKHKFSNDYIYIIFPKVDPGFGSGLDGVSKNFSFSTKANYEYRPYGITGLMLFGEYVEILPKCSRLQKNVLLVRTLAFDNCSKLMKGVLANFDMNRINMRLRNEQVKALLKNDRKLHNQPLNRTAG